MSANDPNAPQEMMDASTSAWIREGYLDDEDAKQMSEIQGRQFLRTGVKPVVGQRAELKMLLNREVANDAHLSGQVVGIGSEPETIYPMTGEDDKEGSNFLSQMLGHFIVDKAGMERHDGIAFKPLQGFENEGSFFMSKGTWEMLLEASDAQKEALNGIKEFSTQLCGAKHGQRVVCEGRLNFDHDMRRGKDNGPWADGIPIDGRDIYSWELVLNDHLKNKWVLDKESLRNLGREHHPRCWPWSNENQLPYERTGFDRLDRNEEGGMVYHQCIGPFGCPGEDHPHGFAGAA